MFGEKSPGKMYNIYWCRRYFRSAFSFSPVSPVPSTFGKTFFTSKLLVSEKVTNLVG